MSENETPKGAKYVTVACKVPNGLVLRAFKMHEEHEPVMGGGSRKYELARTVGDPFRVNGPAPMTALPQFDMPGGYALTANVPIELWTQWLEANKDSAVVKNKLIFATATPEAASKQAKEQESVRSNLEQLDTSTVTKNGRETNVDPRWPKAVPTSAGGSGISPIRTGERAA